MVKAKTFDSTRNGHANTESQKERERGRKREGERQPHAVKMIIRMNNECTHAAYT